MTNTVFTEVEGDLGRWCWRRLFENGWSIVGQPENMTVSAVCSMVDHGQALTTKALNLGFVEPGKVWLTLSNSGLTAGEMVAGLRNVDAGVVFGSGQEVGGSAVSYGSAQGWCWTRLFSENVFFTGYSPIISVSTLLCLANQRTLTEGLIQMYERLGGGLHFELVDGGCRVVELLEELAEKPGETWCGGEQVYDEECPEIGCWTKMLGAGSVDRFRIVYPASISMEQLSAFGGMGGYAPGTFVFFKSDTGYHVRADPAGVLVPDVLRALGERDVGFVCNGAHSNVFAGLKVVGSWKVLYSGMEATRLETNGGTVVSIGKLIEYEKDTPHGDAVGFSLGMTGRANAWTIQSGTATRSALFAMLAVLPLSDLVG